MRGLLTRIRRYRPGPWACVLLAAMAVVGVTLAPPWFSDGRPDHAAQQAQHDALDRRIPALDYNAVRLDEVLAQLGHSTGLQIVVRWEQLAAQGVKPSSPVSMYLWDPRADIGLQRILQNVGAKPDYHFDRRGRLVIGVDTDLFERRYECRDLLAGHPGCFGGWETSLPYRRASPQEVAEGMVAYCASGSWEENGGLGTIRCEDGAIIARQSFENHRRVRSALAIRRSFGSDGPYFDRRWHGDP